MYTVASCLIFMTIYSLYAISNKTEIEKSGLMLFLNQNKTLTKLLAGLAFCLGTSIFIVSLSLAVGIFACLCMTMVLASLMILLLPFNVLKWFHFSALFFVLLLAEILTRQ